MHWTIESVLRAELIGALQTDWAERLPHVELAINSTVARSTGKVPFEVAYGDNVRLPMDFTLDTPVQVWSAEEVA